MGQASRKLANRFRHSRRCTQGFRQQANQDAVRIPTDVKNSQHLVEHERYDPLHAAYIAAQNLLSFFAEFVSTFEEFDAYCAIVGEAEDAYIPSGPPLSPITVSYFTTWALFDVRFGPDQETMSTCLREVAELVGMDTRTLETVQNVQASRMGIYEHVGRVASRVRLRELVTGDTFECYVAAGYLGKEGELWYVRRCPPLRDLCNYHIIFTTPYVLTETSKADWTAYLNKSILETGRTDRRTALHEVLKYGREPRFWSEFIVLGYHHYQPDAIFLAGLPDVQGSLPQANEGTDCELSVTRKLCTERKGYASASIPPRSVRAMRGTRCG